MDTGSHSKASGRPGRAKDGFTTVVYAVLAVVAAIELFSVFWLDLF